MRQREGERMTPLAVAYLGPNGSPWTALPAVLSKAISKKTCLKLCQTAGDEKLLQ